METQSLVDSAIIIAAIVGTAQALKIAFPEQFHGIVLVLTALVLGLLAGFGGLLGLTPISGIFYGLAAVATHTLATKK